MVLNQHSAPLLRRAAELPQASLHLAPGAESRELHECCKCSLQRCLKASGVFVCVFVSLVGVSML